MRFDDWELVYWERRSPSQWQAPEWLATSKQKHVLDTFSDFQMETIFELIEARFWHGTIAWQSGYFWHWMCAFDTPKK